MLTSVKTHIDRTKKFVKDHQTLVACVTTAVVASKFSHDVTLKGVLDETTKMAYEWGAKHGEMEVVTWTALEFIGHKGLNKEYSDFAIDLVKK